jgi:outer membrane autotransporter protein
MWGRGYGFYENVNGQSYAQGDYTAAMGGVMFGADAALDSGLLAGAFAGFTPGDLSIQSTLGNTQISLMGLNFGGYASWSPQDGASYVQGYAMAGYNQADQTRNIQIPGLIRTANSTANVWGAMVGGEGGLNLKLGDKAVLQPYVSLDYGYYTRGAYNETGAGSLDLSVSSQDANLLQPMGGARVMQSFDVGRDRITPFVGAAFVAQLPLGSWSESATNGFSGAQVFSYSEGADNQYGASFQAGLEFATANRWTAYISFNGMAMTDTTLYGGQIGINIPF